MTTAEQRRIAELERGMHYGLRNFSVTVTYEDDFGVNADLKAAAERAGLDLGGTFEDHQATVWRIVGQFQEMAA